MFMVSTLKSESRSELCCWCQWNGFSWRPLSGKSSPANDLIHSARCSNQSSIASDRLDRALLCFDVSVHILLVRECFDVQCLYFACSCYVIKVRSNKYWPIISLVKIKDHIVETYIQLSWRLYTKVQ